MARFDFCFFDSGARFDTPDSSPSASMRNLAHFLDNPFDDRNISEAELAAFTSDHLARMIANNAGNELDARITATQSAYDLFADCVTDDDARLAIRMARKQAKNNYRRATIPKDLARIEGAFVSVYGKDSTVMIELLPQGLTLFQTCQDDEVAGHLQNLLAVVTAHQADLPPSIITLATALHTNWLTVYQASETSTGSKTTTQEGKKSARQNLQYMLYLNLCKLMEMFCRQPEKLPVYMQQHLLENHTPSGEPEPEPPPEPPPPPEA